MDVPDKLRLEQELLAVQKEKVIAEIAVLRRTTPFTETVKLFGSMVLGIGGAVAAFAGFQLAEVRAEKFKLEAERADQAKSAAARDLAQLKAEASVLAQQKSDLERQRGDLLLLVEGATRDLASLSDQLGAARQQAASPAAAAALQAVQQSANAAAIDLRASSPPSAGAATGASLQALVEKLFAPVAAERGAAYDELIARYARDPQLVPALLRHAEMNMANGNGIYNTLVVLSHVDLKATGADLQAVRAFAAKARSVGPKTAERADKLLGRLARG